MSTVPFSAFLSPLFIAQTPTPDSTDDGLTLAEVIQSLPVDPASIVALLLVAGFVVGVVWFGTRGGGGSSAGSPANPGPGAGRGGAPGST